MKRALLSFFLGTLGLAVMSQKTFAAAVPVVPAEFTGAKQPQIAIDSKGDIFVAFGRESSVFVARSSDGGKTFRTPTEVGQIEKLALGMRRGPRIVAARRTITVSAISHGAGNLVSWSSGDGGTTWAAPLRINEVPGSAREGLHGVAGDGANFLFAVWLDLRNKGTELWGARSADGGLTWEQNVRVYESPDKSICECCHPSVAVTTEGDVIAMWRNSLEGNRDMYQARSRDGGRSFGKAVKLGTGIWRLQGCPMDGGSLTVLLDDVVHTWRREGNLFTSSSNVPEKLLGVGTQPIVVATPKGPEFIWQNGGDLYWKGGVAGEPELLARGAAYASAVWSPSLQAVLMVWESTTPGGSSIEFSRGR